MTDRSHKSRLAIGLRIVRERIAGVGPTTLLLLFSLVRPGSAGTINFLGPTNYPVGTAPVAVAVGDWNGDGKQDLAVVNSGSSSVSILQGNGDGTFQPAKSYSVGTNPVFLAAGDFNQDHNADLAVALAGDISNGQTGGVSILLGNGDGTFQAARNLSTDAIPNSLALGDFDGDGRPDLAVAQGGPVECVTVLLGNGDGTFQPSVDYIMEFNANSVAVGDFNGDHNPDIVVATGSDFFRRGGGFMSLGAVSVLIGNGDGTFQPGAVYDNGANDAMSVALGDFNGDGKVDLAVASTYFLHKEFEKPMHAGFVDILLGNGDGTFPSENTVTNDWDIFAAIGDIDSDSKLDVIILDGLDARSLQVLRGAGDGTLEDTANVLPAGSDPVFVGVGDFNGDLLPDLVVVDAVSNDVGILLNAGPTPTFTLSVEIVGTGTGTITSNPPGIDCGTACSEAYSSGTMVTLSAAPAEGSTFTDWGTPCAGIGPCRVTMTRDRLVTATFNAVSDFSLSASAFTPSSVTAGQSARASVSVVASGGFKSAVTFACSVQPSPAQAPLCSPDPGSSPSGTILAVSTTAPTSARGLINAGSERHYAVYLPLIGLLMGGASFPSKPMGKRRILGLLLFSTLLSGLILQLACGSSNTGSSGGTPQGTYTITVTGTSGGTQRSAILTLTVQ
jgi:hypothetical protein